MLKTSDLDTKLSEKKIITESNFATKLSSKLSDTSVKDALKSAGFASSNEVSDSVVTMSDLSKLLSGGLVVDESGKVKLDSNSTKATAITNKLTAANISTTGTTTSTNIANSVANATAAAVAASSEELNEDTCNKTDYMFWDSYAEENKGKCDKCPDESEFSKEGSGESRCVCKDPGQTFTYKDGKWQCIKASSSSDCLRKDNTYWNGDSCNECPEGTYFDAKSSTRCVCEDKSMTFNSSTGKCIALDESACAGQKMYWNIEKSACTECPANAPFSSQAGTCICKESNFGFNNLVGGCKECPEGSEYNEQTSTCICPDKQHIDYNEWKCVENK